MEPFAPIQGINQQLSPIQSLSVGGPEKTDKKEGELTFAGLMSKQLQGVNNALNEADVAKDKLIRGELKNTHELSITGMKAGIMLRMTTAICSKVSSACTTLFQMQI